MQIQLSRTQAGPGRAVKEQQEQNSPNHVQRINLPSVLYQKLREYHIRATTALQHKFCAKPPGAKYAPQCTHHVPKGQFGLQRTPFGHWNMGTHLPFGVRSTFANLRMAQLHFASALSTHCGVLRRVCGVSADNGVGGGQAQL